MPRILTTSSCLTCRRRKLKCDEAQPVCQSSTDEHASNIPLDLDPKDALQEAEVARLFHHYVSNLASWYDLSDSARHFSKHVPYEALSQPLLFNALIAFAAIHLSRTKVPSLQARAETHHARCVQLLIELSGEQVKALGGIALAAVCLLRSYEILAEDFDPNRHLSGAYALAAGQGLNLSTPSILRAGFFNYLREDITFSLITRQPLKLDSKRLDIEYDPVTDEDQLNTATLHLARIVNTAFGGQLTADNSYVLESRLEQWHGSLPAHFGPYHNFVQGSGSIFPTVRMLAECHASIAHYYIVARSIVAIHRAEDASTRAKLHCWAVRLCGIAFSYDTPAVIVNWFGPVSYCGRYLQDEALQTDLVRRLQSYKKDTGWPVQRFIDDLKRYWAGDS
ncbi:hypothetical protein KC343_g3489 [Hortaea werneckii]|nr:hypothetical protein KC352_g11286 [Hortaea werneckii]KAI7567392.1 hypothetical protein KC317_g5008 [Hortaea werneckii]KAI7621093.1 hypothetical protein KC346_g3808 [Hortaea werneckii]KAI7632407.1 hypothetical protein KC343_g3489 [Hortaea werneckii]